MNADEARQITERELQSTVIEKYVDHINNRIHSAAKQGKRRVHDPEIGRPEHGFEFRLGSDEEDAVRKHFESEGFVWTYHPDPDPGHPCSAPYTTLEW